MLRPRVALMAPRFALLLAFVAMGCPKNPAPPTPLPTPEPGPAAQVVDGRTERSLPDGESDPPKVALGVHGAVASAEAAASEVGLEILQAGGNAVDAAIAVGFALAVTHPSAGNLGGGGFMVVRMDDGTLAAIDYRETAPSRATRDMYLDASGEPTMERLVGPKAAGIPGTVAGFALAHQKFGTIPWAELVAPAVELAREGVELDSWHADDLRRAADRLRTVGLASSAAYFVREDGTPYEAGERWVQPELAETLAAIAEGGPRAFYEGPLAKTLAEEVQRAGGIWSEQDLASYRAVEREPIVFDYRGHQVITMPPPSGGGVVLRQLMAAAEALEMAEEPWRSVDEVHLHAEAARRLYADRNMLMGDPDFVEMPLGEMLDPAYAKARVADVDRQRATPSSEISAGALVRKDESVETTHYSVVDDAGNAVSNTYTLNTGFGSGFVVPGTGVLLNNEMDDFAAKPGSPNVFGLVQGEPNRIEPGKRMLSSMTPTIVTKDGELRAILGSPGGPTITTTVAQLLRALVDYGLPLDRAVDAVRVHHQWLPDAIVTEERIPAELEAGLRARGHDIREWATIGHANVIEVDPKTGGYRAVADVTRDGGKAVAY